MIKIDIVTLALARNYADMVAAGFSSVTVDEATSTIKFVLNDGSTTSLTVPTPKDGTSITDVAINNEKHLICILSNGETEDAGEIPEQIINISSKSGNAIQKLEDGYYVSPTGVNISNKDNNIISQEEDGIYAPSLEAQKNILEPIVLDIFANNIEQEDINFEELYS